MHGDARSLHKCRTFNYVVNIIIGLGRSASIITVFAVLSFTQYNRSAIISCDTITMRITRKISHYQYTTQLYLHAFLLRLTELNRKELAMNAVIAPDVIEF